MIELSAAARAAARTARRKSADPDWVTLLRESARAQPAQAAVIDAG